MEKRGIQTNIGNLNREIRAANSLMKSIRQLIQNLKGWITELGEKRKELLAQKAAEEATLLPNLLMKYMEISSLLQSLTVRRSAEIECRQTSDSLSDTLKCRISAFTIYVTRMSSTRQKFLACA